MGRTGSSHTQTTPSQYNPKRKRRPLHFWQEKAMAPHSSTLVWKNPMDGRAWKTAVHGVAKGRARLSDFTFTFHFSRIGEGNGIPLQCSCLENPRDGGAWWAAVYRVAQSRIRLKWLSRSSNTTLLLPGRGRKIFPLAWQELSQRETVTAQPMKSHYTLNSQFLSKIFFFITAPPNFSFSPGKFLFHCFDGLACGSPPALNCNSLLLLNKHILLFFFFFS